MFRLGLISTNFILSQAELNKKCPIYPEGYIGHDTSSRDAVG